MSIEANSKIESLKKALFLALSDLHRRDWVLFGNNVNERTVCARLMFYLERRKYNRWFRHYFVDVDYNRGEGDRLKAFVDEQNVFVGNIVPDLVVHGRGILGEPENLLCLEMKKASRSRQAKSDDRSRVKGLTAPKSDVWVPEGNYTIVAGYMLGVYYEFDSARQQSIIELYKDGRLSERIEKTFSEIANYYHPAGHLTDGSYRRFRF